MTPDTGMKSDMGSDFDGEMVAKAVAETIDGVYARTGKSSILVTHSQGGRAGWFVPKYTNHVGAIIAIEPGGGANDDTYEYKAIVEKNIPVAMYFGDYIDNVDSKIAATAAWQGMRQSCYDFADTYTKDGRTAEVIDLPEEGITGNDHFIFQDLNNDVVADHVENWIKTNIK